MNKTMANIEATFVMVVRAAFFEKFPNTYPMINTIQAANSILIKIITGKNIVVEFK
jgi:hypothetical protein